MIEWTQLIETGFQKLGELAGKYGAPAIDTAAQVVHADAVGSLVRGAVCLSMAGAVVVGGVKLSLRGYRRRAAEAERIRKYNDGKSYPWTERMDGDFALHQIVPGIIVAIIAGIFVIGIIYDLTDQWQWIALWNPKLALAAKVVHALPGMGQ